MGDGSGSELKGESTSLQSGGEWTHCAWLIHQARDATETSCRVVGGESNCLSM